MYEYIKGIFMGINKDYIVVENNDIGYKIFTSGNTMSQIPGKNEKIVLYVEQIVREDFIGLYGFLTKEELDMFKLLLTINGVGAKAALSLLSIASVNNLKYAVVTGDEVTITKAPGIGKKTAQRIILELKDKVKLEEVILEDIDKDETNILSINHGEVLEALVALGYSQKEAEKAFKNIEKSDSIEGMIKDCLKYLMS